MDSNNYSRILRNWRLEFERARGDLPLAESPGSVAAREVLVDTTGAVWVLEEVDEESYSRKVAMAENMEMAAAPGAIPLPAYRRNTLGQFVTSCQGSPRMLRPYVEGIELDPRVWLSETWRAKALADYLINLKRSTNTSPAASDSNTFSIVEFVKGKTEALGRFRPEIERGLHPVFQALDESLFPALAEGPVGFCHGDFRPLNVIWGADSILGVVSWDFCGAKPETYDAALLVGCVGFDDPDALTGEFTTAFVHALRDAAVYAPESWNLFFDLAIALRYYRLAEWTRQNDENARDMEILYMNLLTKQKGYILKHWGLA